MSSDKTYDLGISTLFSRIIVYVADYNSKL